MELLVVVLALGAGLYFFFKRNTERGANTVRAYMYLSAIREGCTVEEANQIANTDASELSSQMIHGAKLQVQTHYGGKQLPFIADAVRAGFVPR